MNQSAARPPAVLDLERGISGHHDHPGPGRGGPEVTDRGETVGAGHGEIQHDQVRSDPGREFHRGRGVAGLGDDLEGPARGQLLTQETPAVVTSAHHLPRPVCGERTSGSLIPGVKNTRPTTASWAFAWHEALNAAWMRSPRDR